MKDDSAKQKPVRKVLAIGKRLRMSLAEIVGDPDLRARLEGVHGVWGISSDVVMFTTPNIGRDAFEVVAVRTGHAIVSFSPSDSHIAERPSVEIEVVSEAVEEVEEETSDATVKPKTRKPKAK